MAEQIKKNKIKYNYLTRALSIAVVVFMLSCAWLTTVVIAMGVPSTGYTASDTALIILSPQYSASPEEIRLASVQFASLRKLDGSTDGDKAADVVTDLFIVTDNNFYNDSNPTSKRWTQVESLPILLFENGKIPSSVNPNSDAAQYNNHLSAPFSDMSNSGNFGSYKFNVTLGDDVSVVKYSFKVAGIFDIEKVIDKWSSEITEADSTTESETTTTDETTTDDPHIDEAPIENRIDISNEIGMTTLDKYFKDYPALYNLFTPDNNGVTDFERFFPVSMRISLDDEYIIGGKDSDGKDIFISIGDIDYTQSFIVSDRPDENGNINIEDVFTFEWKWITDNDYIDTFYGDCAYLAALEGLNLGYSVNIVLVAEQSEFSTTEPSITETTAPDTTQDTTKPNDTTDETTEPNTTAETTVPDTTTPFTIPETEPYTEPFTEPITEPQTETETEETETETETEIESESVTEDTTDEELIPVAAEIDDNIQTTAPVEETTEEEVIPVAAEIDEPYPIIDKPGTPLTSDMMLIPLITASVSLFAILILLVPIIRDYRRETEETK